MSQPFQVAQVFTGFKGRLVSLKDTVRSFKEILAGTHDSLPESAFYMIGTIEDVKAKAEQLANRSGLLKPSGTTPDSKNTAKVVLLSLDQNCEYDDCLTANVADAHFSTFEGRIQAISNSHGSVGLGRNPGKCYMSVLVHFWERGSHQVVTTQALLDRQNVQWPEAQQGCSL